MFQIAVIGSGQIGRLVGVALCQQPYYQVHLIDQVPIDKNIDSLLTSYSQLSYHQIDVATQLDSWLADNQTNAVITCLPYQLNSLVAQLACKHQVHYFDLTEDRGVTDTVNELGKSAQSILVPQCGLAPGWVNWSAHDLMSQFDELRCAEISAGALPQNSANDLHYALNWSTTGLVNEYLNACEIIQNGKLSQAPALGDLKPVQFNGDQYESFHTSGGLGSLAKYYENKIDNLSYKTLRYPGHCNNMKTIISQFNAERHAIEAYLTETIPTTPQDVVVLYLTVSGYIDGKLTEKNRLKKYYPKKIDEYCWTAIQLTTAFGVCCAVDHVLNNQDRYQGTLQHQDLALTDLMATPFGEYYDWEEKCIHS